jgi:hypothetical protein
MALRIHAQLAMAGILGIALTSAAIAQQGAPPNLLSDPTASGSPSNRPTRLPDPAPDQPSSASIVFFGQYDFLRLRRSNSDYAIVDPNTDTVPEGPVQSLNDPMQSGFRAGGFYRPRGASWDIGFTYSYFQSIAAETTVAPPGGLLYATQTRPGVIETVDTATANTQLDYNVFDIEFGRTFAIDQSVAVRALIGVRVADIGFDSLTLYDGRDAALARVASGFQFTGAGLIIGGEAQWTMTRFISIFGRARGGLIVGSNDSRLRETNNDSTVLDTDITQHSRQLVPLLEMSLGASVHYGRFELRGGYEIANWFQLMTQPDFTDDIHKGKIVQRQSSLGLDGFFVQLGVSF